MNSDFYVTPDGHLITIQENGMGSIFVGLVTGIERVYPYLPFFVMEEIDVNLG